jgi:hypothetical protein
MTKTDELIDRYKWKRERWFKVWNIEEVIKDLQALQSSEVDVEIRKEIDSINEYKDDWFLYSYKYLKELFTRHLSTSKVKEEVGKYDTHHLDWEKYDTHKLDGVEIELKKSNAEWWYVEYYAYDCPNCWEEECVRETINWHKCECCLAKIKWID